MEDMEVVYERDGDQWLAHRVGFINIMESVCGFGDTQEEALKELELAEQLEKEIEEAGEAPEEVGAALDMSDIEM